jgi:hypothetical protein
VLLVYGEGCGYVEAATALAIPIDAVTSRLAAARSAMRKLDRRRSRFPQMTVDDAELVALIDNELDEEAKGSLLARLAADEGLRRRYEALHEAGALISVLSTRCSRRRRSPGSAWSFRLESVARLATPPGC